MALILSNIIKYGFRPTYGVDFYGLMERKMTRLSDSRINTSVELRKVNVHIAANNNKN